MKARVETSVPGSSHRSSLALQTTQDGKINKTRHHMSQNEEENEEIKAYLAKLQQLVPFMPKNRKLSKLEVVTYVIEYIRDLKNTLGIPAQNRRLPSGTGAVYSGGIVDPFEFMSQADLSLSVLRTNSSDPTTSSVRTSPPSYTYPSHQPQSRQPLVVISTANNSSTFNDCFAPQEIQIPHIIEKTPTMDVDSRPVSS